MTQWNKDTVARLLARSGRIALEHFDAPVREYKSDATVVTQADRAIEASLAAELDKPDEGSYLLGEETLEGRSEDYIASALKKTAWIVDPIDGTISYAHHFPMWGVSIALARGGVIREGALYLPIGGDMLVSDGEKIFHGRVAPDAENPGAGLKPFTPPFLRPDPKGVIALAQGYVKKGGFSGGNALHATGSAVFSLAHLVLGNYLAYRANLKLWDLAGGVALIEKAGFLMRFEDGRPFGTSIDEVLYRLGPEEGHKRWKARGRVIFAPTAEAADYVVSCFSSPA